MPKARHGGAAGSIKVFFAITINDVTSITTNSDRGGWFGMTRKNVRHEHEPHQSCIAPDCALETFVSWICYILKQMFLCRVNHLFH
jgi:hypothetical protein